MARGRRVMAVPMVQVTLMDLCARGAIITVGVGGKVTGVHVMRELQHGTAGISTLAA